MLRALRLSNNACLGGTGIAAVFPQPHYSSVERDVPNIFLNRVMMMEATDDSPRVSVSVVLRTIVAAWTQQVAAMLLFLRSPIVSQVRNSITTQNAL